MRAVLTTICVTALAVVCPLGAQANPLDAVGFGARAIAMGGAFTSLADDSSANYYNPAGLAQSEDLRFDLGYLFAQPELDFNGEDANVDVVKGIQGGVVIPGEVLERRFGVGIAMFLLDDRITRIRALPQQQPRFVLFDNRIQRLFITANFALEPIDHFYIGGGVTFLSDSTGTVHMSGDVSLTDVERTALQAAVDVDLKSARYAELGILYAPDAPWSLGLAFRDEFFLHLNLVTHVTGRILADTNPESPIVVVEDGSFRLETDYANLYTPRQLVLGGSYTVGLLTFAADLGWYMWSGYRPEASQVTIDLDLGTLDFAIPPTDDILEPEFHDIFIPRMGVEAVLVESDHVGLQLRGGYFFEDSPAPDQPGRTNYADGAKHGLSAGLGFAFIDFTEVLPKPLLLDISFLAILMNQRDYLKDDPADLVGDYSVDGEIFALSILMGILL